MNLLAIEFILLNIVLVLFLYLRLPEFSFSDTIFLGNMAKLVLVYNLSWLFIILFIRDNEFYFNEDYGYFKNVLTSLFFFVGLVTSLVVLLKISYFARSTFIIPIFIFSYLLFISTKNLLKFLKKRGSHLFSNTLLIGTGYGGNGLTGFTNAMTQYGYNVMGYLYGSGNTPTNNVDLSILDGINNLPKVLANHSIDEIFVSMSNMQEEKILSIVKIADDFGVRVKLIPENPLLISKSFKPSTMGNLAVFRLRQSPLDNFNLTVLKRIFDFVFALTILIVFSPYIFVDSNSYILK